VARLRTMAPGCVALLSLLLAFALLSDGPTTPPLAKSAVALSADDGDRAAARASTASAGTAAASAGAGTQKRYRPAATRPAATASRAAHRPGPAGRQGGTASSGAGSGLLPAARRRGAPRHRPSGPPAVLQVFRC
jgi:hypothetical protein